VAKELAERFLHQTNGREAAGERQPSQRREDQTVQEVSSFIAMADRGDINELSLDGTELPVH
jgi:hypothetical protein